MGQICNWCKGGTEIFYLGVPLCDGCQDKLLAAMPNVFDRLAKLGELRQADAEKPAEI